MSKATMSKPKVMSGYEVRVVGLNDDPFVTNDKAAALAYSSAMGARGYLTKLSVITLEMPRQSKFTYNLGCTASIYKGHANIEKVARSKYPAPKRKSWEVTIRMPDVSGFLQPKWKSSLLKAA